MKTPGFLSVGQRDAIKGLILASITAIITGLYTSLQSGHLPATADEWKVIGLSAITAGLSYVTKNFLTNSNDQFLKKETPNA